MCPVYHMSCVSHVRCVLCSACPVRPVPCMSYVSHVTCIPCPVCPMPCVSPVVCVLCPVSCVSHVMCPVVCVPCSACPMSGVFCALCVPCHVYPVSYVSYTLWLLKQITANLRQRHHSASLTILQTEGRVGLPRSPQGVGGWFLSGRGTTFPGGGPSSFLPSRATCPPLSLPPSLEDSVFRAHLITLDGFPSQSPFDQGGDLWRSWGFRHGRLGRGIVPPAR